MKLHIVGNGFDLAHGLPTRYYDFRDYLEEIDWSRLQDFEFLYGSYTSDNPNITGDPLWQDFESTLSHVDETFIVDNATSMELGLETGDIDIKDTLDIHWEEEYGYIEKLNSLIDNWIRTIDIGTEKVVKDEYINEDDLYLSFNYTLLLEELYNLEDAQVLHIHGSIREDDIEATIGHGDNHKIQRAKEKANQAEIEFNEKLSSIMSAVANYYERTLKNTSEFLSLNDYFFRSFIHVDEIFVVGCSFGNVDIPYFQRINQIVNSNVMWNIIYHEAYQEVEFRTIVESLGVDSSKITMIHSSDYFK